MTKQWYVIKKQDGELIKSDGKVLFFETADEAMTYITISCGNSPYVNIEKWRGK